MIGPWVKSQSRSGMDRDAALGTKIAEVRAHDPLHIHMRHLDPKCAKKFQKSIFIKGAVCEQNCEGEGNARKETQYCPQSGGSGQPQFTAV
jgi:hypothetical protein